MGRQKNQLSFFSWQKNISKKQNLQVFLTLKGYLNDLFGFSARDPPAPWPTLSIGVCCRALQGMVLAQKGAACNTCYFFGIWPWKGSLNDLFGFLMFRFLMDFFGFSMFSISTRILTRSFDWCTLRSAAEHSLPSKRYTMWYCCKFWLCWLFANFMDIMTEVLFLDVGSIAVFCNVAQPIWLHQE